MFTRSLVLLLSLSAIASGFVSPSTMTAFVSSTNLNMAEAAPEVKVGDKLPFLVLKEGQPDYEKPVDVDLADLIKGKKVAIFAVPGAFTPGCSKSHLPSFIEAQDELKAKDVELTICIATNDAYVMQAWGSSSGGEAAGIRFLSDANAELSRALGLSIESDVMVRTKRFSLIAEDGVVTHYFSADEEASNTFAPSVLASL
mmetsp:Transcript_23420/g.28168  ORF Transcript_23420/g.28168 Transcript_23420/m.28168 type:complete len:200 (+) Transcript_23420:50-649(+)